MSLFNRRNILAAFIATIALSGCGYTPIYGEGTAATSLREKIEITAGKGRESFEMRERMVERFGFANNPRYTLVFSYDVSSKGLAVSTTAEITRYNLTGISEFKVTDISTGKVVFSSKVKSLTAYSATSETYPTRVAEQDARTRLALTLADQIITRVSSTASQWAK
jgi:LPS-assembly lipoprotein